MAKDTVEETEQEAEGGERRIAKPRALRVEDPGLADIAPPFPPKSADSYICNPDPYPRLKPREGDKLYDSAMEALHVGEEEEKVYKTRTFAIARVEGGKYRLEWRDKPARKPKLTLVHSTDKPAKAASTTREKKSPPSVPADAQAATPAQRTRSTRARSDEPTGPAAKVFALLLAAPNGLSRRALADKMGWKAPAHQKLFHDNGKGYCDRWPAYHLTVVGSGKDEVYKLTKDA